MTQSCEGKRSIEFGLGPMNSIEDVLVVEAASKLKGCAHGAHGVGTGGADSDLVQVEEAGRHAEIVA